MKVQNKKVGPKLVQFDRTEPLKKPVLPTPSKMYQGKAKNGPITPRKLH